MLIHCPLPISMSSWSIEELAVFYPEAKVGLMGPRSPRPHDRSVRPLAANTNFLPGMMDGGE
jgi:hypothetical protein